MHDLRVIEYLVRLVDTRASGKIRIGGNDVTALPQKDAT
jgi:ABC-type multidrug transport system fused ATPase/permease subunit